MSELQMNTEQATFEVEGDTFSLDEMLRGNSDDQEFCEWLRSAAVGDQFAGGAGCRRVA